MILRRAQLDDAIALTKCIKAAYAPFMDLGLPPVAEGVADDIRNRTVWVAEFDGTVKGGIVLALDKTAHIVNLAVHPDAGGHGIGKALICAAMDAAKAAGYAQIDLATHIEMTGTQAFYRKTGWDETGREDNKVYFKRELI
ncbi:GNAT family N-acetyltransferase [Yoonia sp.]|uniref:GNAT family N-acetyltransferase n=1 Tax=Yoonia sp. TaxID=2212373 RepID=UPI0035C82D89